MEDTDVSVVILVLINHDFVLNARPTYASEIQQALVYSIP